MSSDDKVDFGLWWSYQRKAKQLKAILHNKTWKLEPDPHKGPQ